MLFACDWKAAAPDLPANLVRSALSISGLHDLRPLQHAPFIEKAIRLGDADALRLSPALGPVPAHGTFYTVAGGDESEEFIRQNALIRDAWGRDVVPVCEVLPGLHHFSIVDTLASPGQRLHGLAMQLLQA
jgi:arylformamidase